VLFDRITKDKLVMNPVVKHGLYHHAGDEFETMWPGYEVIKLQQKAPVVEASGRWSGSSVHIDELSAAETYSFSGRLEGYPPSIKAETEGGSPSLHLDTTLTGIDVFWIEPGPGKSRCWLPHLDNRVNNALLGAHMPDFSKATYLSMRTRLDLWSMLRPAVQPGQSLDYEPLPEEVTVRISSPTTAFTVTRSTDAAAKPEPSQLGQVTHDAFITVTPQRNAPLDLAIVCKAAPDFQISWHTKQDPRERAMPLRRFLVPWCKPELTPGLAAPLPRPELQGGDWARGKTIFNSNKALCAKCHSVRGVGGKIGPDLANLTSREFSAVQKDIHDPNATLNPDYITHEVKLKDGKQYSAVLRSEGDEVVLGVGAGVEVRVKKGDIVSQTPLKTSIMLPALDDVLGKTDFRDLMAYLLTEPPLMGVYADGERPAKRTRAEIDAVLAGAPSPALPTRELKIVFVSGKKDHGKGEHDYPRWREVWSRLFTLADKVSLDLADEWPSAEQWKTADTVVFFRRGDWSDSRALDFDAFLARGGGATFIHWALEAGDAAPALADRLGLASNRAQTKYRHGPLSLVFDTSLNHPIARNFTQIEFSDEMYWNLVPSAKTSVKPIATAADNGVSFPQMWTQEPATGGRIFVTLGGHYSWNFDDPMFRTLVLRGIAWSVKEPVDRFNNLIEAGVE
jgi:putative heme-binding domain-containing protein